MDPGVAGSSPAPPAKEWLFSGVRSYPLVPTRSDYSATIAVCKQHRRIWRRGRSGLRPDEIGTSRRSRAPSVPRHLRSSPSGVVRGRVSTARCAGRRDRRRRSEHRSVRRRPPPRCTGSANIVHVDRCPSPVMGFDERDLRGVDRGASTGVGGITETVDRAMLSRGGRRRAPGRCHGRA